MLEEATLSGMAKHWQTGAPIPKPLVDKIRAAKNYRAASAMLSKSAPRLEGTTLYDLHSQRNSLGTSFILLFESFL